MEIIKNKESIIDKRALERTVAENAQLKANLDYVAMMSDINIPTEDTSEVTNNA